MKARIEFPPRNSGGLCREVCLFSAIRPSLPEPRHLYEVITEKCTGCGECLDYCPAPGAPWPMIADRCQAPLSATLVSMAADGRVKPRHDGMGHGFGRLV